MKLLALDIETAPHTAYVWRLFDDHVPLDRLKETGRVMCFSAKWVGEKGRTYFLSEKDSSHAAMVASAHAFLDEADAVVTFNGKKFDIPMLNAAFAKYKLGPPAPYHHIDLYQIVRRRFKLASNKLQHVLEFFGLSPKEDHRGFQLWVDCMEGKASAWREMKTYNKQDVDSLIELYEYILPWIDNHPNLAVYTDAEDPICTNCGSDDLESRGTQYNKTLTYRRFQCNDCNTWVRGRLPDKKGRAAVTQIKL